MSSSRLVFAALLTAGGAACGDRGAFAPLPDLVYIFPPFVEAYNENIGPGFLLHRPGHRDKKWDEPAAELLPSRPSVSPCPGPAPGEMGPVHCPQMAMAGPVQRADGRRL